MHATSHSSMRSWAHPDERARNTVSSPPSTSRTKSKVSNSAISTHRLRVFSSAVSFVGTLGSVTDMAQMSGRSVGALHDESVPGLRASACTTPSTSAIVRPKACTILSFSGGTEHAVGLQHCLTTFSHRHSSRLLIKWLWALCRTDSPSESSSRERTVTSWLAESCARHDCAPNKSTSGHSRKSSLHLSKNSPNGGRIALSDSVSMSSSFSLRMPSFRALWSEMCGSFCHWTEASTPWWCFTPTSPWLWRTLGSNSMCGWAGMLCMRPSL